MNLRSLIFILLCTTHLNAQNNNRLFSAQNYTPIDQSIFNVVVPGSVLYLDAGNVSSYAGSGTIWSDISGNANNMTIPSVLASTFTNTNGGSFLFGQLSTHTITNSSLNNFTFTPSSGISIEAWYKRSVSSDFQFWVSDNTANYRIGIASNGNFFWNMGSRSDRNPSSYTLPSGVWKHIVITGATEGSTIMTRIYVDGVQVLSQDEGYNSLTNFTRLLIGAGELNSIYLLKGNLAVCRIYKKALTSSELLQNFNVHKSRFGL